MQTAEWMDRVRAGETAGDLLLRHAFPFATALDIDKIPVHRFALFRRRDLLYQLMLRGDDHEVNTEYRVGSGGVDTQLFGGRVAEHLKVDLRTVTLPDPVGLHFLHGVTEVDGLQSFEQSFGIVSDAQIPLSQL